MYLFRTREPMLNDDSDATVVIGMLKRYEAIVANRPKR